MNKTVKPEIKTPSPLMLGIKGACPRCGQGKMYDGLLKPVNSCDTRKLNYNFIDSDDRPQIFVILIIGFVITGLAMAVQTNWSPPIWLQMIIWTPVILVACIWALRFSKGIMVALQYKTNASEGQLEK